MKTNVDVLTVKKSSENVNGTTISSKYESTKMTLSKNKVKKDFYYTFDIKLRTNEDIFIISAESWIKLLDMIRGKTIKNYDYAEKRFRHIDPFEEECLVTYLLEDYKLEFVSTITFKKSLFPDEWFQHTKI